MVEACLIRSLFSLWPPQVSWGPYSGEDEAYSVEPLPELCYKADVQAFSRAFQPSVSLTVAALGLAGNGLVLATHLAARRAARSPTSAHLLQLALADLLLALTLPPDPCRLLPSPEACNQTGACTWCHGACLSGDQAHR